MARRLARLVMSLCNRIGLHLDRQSYKEAAMQHGGVLYIQPYYVET